MVEKHNSQKLLVTCKCGQKMLVLATAIGRGVKCPKCSKSVLITRDNTQPYSPLPTKPKITAAPKDRGSAQLVVDAKSNQPMTAQKLVVICECGHRMVVPATAIGKSFKCPKCSKIVPISRQNTRPYSSPLPKPKTASTTEQRDSVKPAVGAKPDQPPISRGLMITCVCGQRMVVPSSAIGKAVKCPKCGKTMPIIREKAKPFVRESGQAVTEDKEREIETHRETKPPQKEPVSNADQEEAYPWNPSPEILSKVEKYNEDSKYKSFLCRCNEYLNGLLKNYTFRDLNNEVELRIYPDLVAVDGREVEPGCLEGLVMAMPDKVKVVVGPILNLLILLIRAPFGIFMALIGFAFLAVVGVLIIIAVIEAPLITIPVIVLLIAARIAYTYINQKRIALIAGKICADPKSSYAIKKLHKLAELVPRIWRPGEVAQLIRLNTRRRGFKRFLILVVQDNPLPDKAGCLSTGIGVFIGRMMRADRRIYVLSFDDGEDAAEQAAKAIADVLKVQIDRAKFVFNNLRLE